MKGKRKQGRPKVKTKRIAVAFMADGDKADAAFKKAEKNKFDLKKDLENHLYDYLSR